VEDAFDLGGQKFDVVAGALLAELAEMREVLANLGLTDVQLVRQFVRRRDLLALGFKLAQRAQVERQPADDNIRNDWRSHAMKAPAPLAISGGCPRL
jgi:hypothetical protein